MALTEIVALQGQLNKMPEGELSKTLCSLIKHKVLLFSNTSSADSEEQRLRTNLFELQQNLE